MTGQDMTEKDRVLSANLEFYRAFTLRDVGAMELLWAQALPVSCVHPGWMALRDRESVMRSWRDILANPEAPHIMCHDEDAKLYGSVAIVTCEETIDDNTLVATNIFARRMASGASSTTRQGRCSCARGMAEAARTGSTDIRHISRLPEILQRFL
jgi:hypothetical protein